jgi:hypothetical protein
VSDATPPDLIAKRNELDNIIAELDLHFDTGMPDDLLDTKAAEWWQLFGEVASPILLTARDSYLRNGQGFPTVDTFAEYIDCAVEWHQLQRSSGGACKCDNGWAPAPPVMRGKYRYDNQYRPCPACRPDQAELHRTQWAPAARRLTPVGPDESMPFNPLEVVRANKARLAAVTRTRFGEAS